MRESHRYLATPKNKPPIREGDVVLVEDRDQPRGFWRLARVQKLLTGKDDQVRGAEVRVSTPTGQITLRRPVQVLYPLELKDPLTQRVPVETVAGSEEAPADPNITQSSGEREPRPSRRAAAQARELFRTLAIDLADDVDVDL